MAEEAKAEDRLRKEFETLRGDVAKLRADMADLLGVLKEEGAAKAGEARGNVEAELRKRREQLRRTLDDVEEKGRRAAHEVEDAVGEHPLSCLLAAFGVGFVLAKMTHHDHGHH